MAGEVIVASKTDSVFDKSLSKTYKEIKAQSKDNTEFLLSMVKHLTERLVQIEEGLNKIERRR